MTDDGLPDLPDVETRFDRRVRTLIDAETTPAELVADLDVASLAGVPRGGDGSDSPFALAPFIRVYLFHEISGIPVATIVDRLDEDTELATSFGFDDVPDQSTISRAKTDRFELDESGRDLNDWIERKAERIIKIAHEEGNPMGLDSLVPDDKRDSSPATKSRHKQSKRNEGAKEAAEMASVVWDFDRADNATYAMETFLQVLAEMSADGKTARAACRLATEPTGDENRKLVGETLRLYPRNLEPAETVRMYDEVSELLMEQIKQYVECDRIGIAIYDSSFKLADSPTSY